MVNVWKFNELVLRHAKVIGPIFTRGQYHFRCMPFIAEAIAVILTFKGSVYCLFMYFM